MIGSIQMPVLGSSRFLFKEQEQVDGAPLRTIEFTEVDIRPCSYEELENAKANVGITIPLEMYNGRIVETNIEGIDSSQLVNIRSTLISPFTSKAIGLVRGGWLPSSLAAKQRDAVILPDRNIVTEIASRFDFDKKIEHAQDFLDLLQGAPVRINPLLFALEGNKRSLPTPDIVRAQLEEAVVKLRKALPEAAVIFGPDSAGSLLRLIEDIRPAMARKQAFLCRVGPTLASPVAHRNMDKRWNDILATAKDCGVPLNSFVVLAALSTLVNPGKSAAKSLLKFSQSYSSADAYNALSDLQSLDLLVNFLALFPEIQTQLCTADRNLALFWVGSGVSDIVRDSDGIRFKLTPHHALLPKHYAERWVAELSLDT